MKFSSLDGGNWRFRNSRPKGRTGERRSKQLHCSPVLGNGFVGDNSVGRVRFGAIVPIDMKTPKTKSVKHKSRTPFFKKRNPIAEAASQAEREKYDAVMRAKTPHSQDRTRLVKAAYNRS